MLEKVKKETTYQGTVWKARLGEQFVTAEGQQTSKVIVRCIITPSNEIHVP